MLARMTCQLWHRRWTYLRRRRQSQLSSKTSHGNVSKYN